MKSAFDLSPEEFTRLLEDTAAKMGDVWPAFIKTYVVPILGNEGITKSVQLDLCDSCAKGYMHNGPVSLPGPHARCGECGIEQGYLMMRVLTGD